MLPMMTLYCNNVVQCAACQLLLWFINSCCPLTSSSLAYHTNVFSQSSSDSESPCWIHLNIYACLFCVLKNHLLSNSQLFLHKRCQDNINVKSPVASTWDLEKAVKAVIFDNICEQKAIEKLTLNDYFQRPIE